MSMRVPWLKRMSLDMWEYGDIVISTRKELVSLVLQFGSGSSF